jgi:hypothetical protein
MSASVGDGTGRTGALTTPSSPNSSSRHSRPGRDSEDRSRPLARWAARKVSTHASLSSSMPTRSATSQRLIWATCRWRLTADSRV